MRSKSALRFGRLCCLTLSFIGVKLLRSDAAVQTALLIENTLKINDIYPIDSTCAEPYTFVPASAPAGTWLSIYGNHLAGIDSVYLGFVPTDSIRILSDSLLQVRVPLGCGVGVIRLIDGSCIRTSYYAFVESGYICRLSLHAFIQGFYLGGGIQRGCLNEVECDSIRIELHEAFPPFALAFQAAGILDVEGFADLVFPGAADGHPYYVVFRHRNALETWSKYPIQMGAFTAFDFAY